MFSAIAFWERRHCVLVGYKKVGLALVVFFSFVCWENLEAATGRRGKIFLDKRRGKRFERRGGECTPLLLALVI